MNKRQASILITSFFVLLASVLATIIVVRSQHTLFNRPDLIHTKNMSHIKSMGSVEFLITRSPLAKNELNLGLWYGHNEIHYHDLPEKIDEVQIELFLERGQRFEMAFGDRDSIESRVTLQKNGFLSSALKFTTQNEQTFIPFGYQLNEENLKLLWRPEELIINDQLIIENPDQTVFSPPFKFQSAAGEVIVKQITFVGPKGRHTLTFSPTLTLWRPFFINLGLFVSVCLLFYLLKLTLIKKISPYALPSFLLMKVVSLTIFLIMDYYYLAPKAYSVGTKTVQHQHYQNHIPLWEQARYHFFNLWFKEGTDYPRDIHDLASRGYPAPKIESGVILCRQDCVLVNEEELTSHSNDLVVFIGTSQTFGIGAHHIDQSFITLSYKNLYKVHQEQTPDFLILAIPGAEGALLMEKYAALIKRLSPEHFVINLGINDHNISREHLRQSLLSFHSLAEELQASLVFMQEARSADHGGFNQDPYLKVIEAIAKRTDRPLWPWHNKLLEAMKAQQKDLWCDVVHLNPDGHHAGAEILTPWLSELLKIR